ncbi:MULTISPECIES: lysylphosphatidylglycerol synthase transmembrane domain-containing protein [Haloferax]|uniref:Flippase-like domain-containing protein n=2 Tax=Haloferax TaxID=2251 RepID=A0A6G1YY27_9EURY|nr:MULTISPECIES: lysylphosphatidylglycerol synthase transmembrane domain-containing protein [Haloferax]KAB1186676.1 flippase-like domain-containing protein [Haloferax sp. CBA1149]MRW79297.1 flippase-like domain-containing protein [Haloferax marinisediminis]
MSTTSIRTQSTWRKVAGIVLALSGFALYVWVVGTTAVVDAVGAVSRRTVVSLAVLGLVPLVAWGTALGVVLRQIGTQVSFWRATVLFTAMEFVNAITPFGQTGGTPVSSLLVAWECAIDYERAFAAVVGVNVVIRLASVALGLFAAVVYSSHLVVVDSVRNIAALVVAVTVGFLVAGAVLWITRHDVEPVVGRALGRLTQWSGRWIPGVSPPAPERAAHRVSQFVATLDELAANPWRLAVVFALAVFGQLSVAAALWTVLDALGVTQPLLLVLVVIPLAKVSGLVPTPGGIGSAVVVLSGLLVAMTGIAGALATAAALVYRGTVYWFPTLVGVVATVGLFLSGRQSTRPRQSRSTQVTAFVLAGSLSAALLVVVHSRTLLVEPADAVVHALLDGGIGVLGFAVVWILLTTATR